MPVYSSLNLGREFKSVDKFTNNDYVHIYDVFSDHEINNIYKKGKPKAIISDHISVYYHNDFEKLDIIFFPGFIQLELNRIYKNKNLFLVPKKNITNCFNFTLNRKQVSRFLCIKLVEYFNLKEFDYTWSAVDQSFDMTDIINELDKLGSNFPESTDFRTCILSNIKLPKKFIVFGEVDMTTVDTCGSISNYGGNYNSWLNGLNDLVNSSAVTLICESLSTQRAAAFTEKTLFSVLGLTFPIWVGGYKQAEEWKKLDFDIFEDVIDHSYQHYDTLIERCYYAFKKNYRILSDLDFAKEQISNNIDRLITNRDLILSDHVFKKTDQVLNNFSGIDQIKKYFIKNS